MKEHNILIDRLPNTVTINGVEYKINSDFRTSLLFDMLIKRRDLSDDEKIICTLNLYFPVLPLDTTEAINAIIWFFHAGKEKEKSMHSGKPANEVYSFEQDASYIYADFLAEYRINLQRIEDTDVLHWWEFLALFESLSENSKMSKIIYYRTVDTSGIPKKQRQSINEMKKLYKINTGKNVTEELKLAKRNADIIAYARKRMEDIEKNTIK